MKSHLEIVPNNGSPSEQVKKAVSIVTPRVLRKQIINIYNKVGAISSPAKIGLTPPHIRPISPNMGMGMELDVRSIEPIIHIDEELLDEVLTRIPDRLTHHHAARYFILSAAGHSLVKDSAYIADRTKEGPNLMMVRAWKIAAGLALGEMGLKPNVQTEIVGSCKAICRNREEEYAVDSMFYTYQAAIHEANPPRLRPVDPWVQGLAFPNTPEEIQSYINPEGFKLGDGDNS